ncbi:Curculin domain protein (mannose-binding) lectin [Cellulomonas flavigena DSM 20109]|uniref:Curculin domain protein (Mannose-binding) lectin n=1 Tax=Cellulomonas flavigena (strain ATCC 482 / DSM 20109 / BCRC 11376 / JCM 18109 / NBRC 3775 / NCIMB 8073 / NRS 134) TaxID=446466 RepID=D5UGN0_CELFN|nr:D-alanyl-D-alanine carboxypeptidase family protein [Cellulomonas flavigena]ADG75128.1 Curculin domain protein (mannose-binding) lectin [Cellulomonas flavigena DSM 20109]
MRRVGATVVAAVLASALAVPAAAGPGEDVLRPGEQLAPGQALLAAGGGHVLVVQPDGALGLYAVTGDVTDAIVRWSSGRGVAGATLVADASGDVRLVAPDGAVLWSTGTVGSGGALRLRDDGEVVVEAADGTAVWGSGTALAPSVLVGPGRIAGDVVLSSPDGRHLLHVDPDSGVQLRGPDGTVRWAPPAGDGAEADPAVALELRADGNLVAVDADGDPVWRSRTAGRGAVSLLLQDDGNLVLLGADGAPVWDAGRPIGPSGLDATGALAGEASLGSPSGHLGVRVTAGALVATWDGAPIWSSSTVGGVTARVQEDGDLVLLDAAGAAVWRSGTAGRPGARLVVEESAVLLVAPNGEVLWQVAVPEALVPTGVQPTDCDDVDGPVAAGDVVRTRSGIVVHPCLAEALDAMVAAARADGIELHGGGWRSPEQQVALRRAHCGPSDADVYDKPASACRPSTARPGSSRHERGLAVDLTSGGRSLTAGSAAYAWLVEHAGAYGLENLPGEPWHWSVDGS